MNLPDTRAMSPEEYDDLLAKQDWAELSQRLTKFAWNKMRRSSWEDAEDVAQTAIRQAFDPSFQRWDPKKQPNVFWFLGHLVNGVLSNRRQQRKHKVEILHDQETLEDLDPEAIDATDVTLAKRQRARLIVEELRRQVATDRAAMAVLLAFESEIDDPHEQAAASGLAMQAVYNARSKLRALAHAIAHTFDQGTVQ